MKWENGLLSEANIFSAIGGNCRVRTKIPVKVVDTTSEQSKGPNPNQFFLTSPVPPFENKSKEPLKYLPSQQKFYEIDFVTEKGKSYTIITM
jgi:alpha-L-fucosidase 2